MGLYGQFPGGGFAGDENCRPGYADPRQGFETCGIVEFMHSFEMLAAITGNPLWADRCEEIAFNSLPAALTPDLKALHYLTGAEHGPAGPQQQVARACRTAARCSPTARDGLPLLPAQPRHGLAVLCRGLWLATADSGLCASLYAASRSDGQGGRRHRGEDRRGDRLSVRRHDQAAGWRRPSRCASRCTCACRGWCRQADGEDQRPRPATSRPSRSRIVVLDATWKTATGSRCDCPCRWPCAPGPRTRTPSRSITAR